MAIGGTGATTATRDTHVVEGAFIAIRTKLKIRPRSIGTDTHAQVTD